MKAILLSLALFGFVAVAPVFAGGDLDVLGLEAYEASVAANAEASGSVAGSSVGEGVDQENGSAKSDMEGSALGSILSSNPWRALLVVIIVGAAAGLLVWAYRRNRVV